MSTTNLLDLGSEMDLMTIAAISLTIVDIWSTY